MTGKRQPLAHISSVSADDIKPGFFSSACVEKEPR
jgi:hypothetical protein